MKEEEYYRILDKLVSYCAYAERCLMDVRKKLRPFDVPQADQQRMIDYLIEHDVVDEKRYALSFATGKLRYNHWGRIKIRAHLKSKYISEKDIHFAFSQLDEEEYRTILQQVISNKLSRTTSDAFAKTVRHAQSKGFELGLILEEMNN